MYYYFVFAPKSAGQLPVSEIKRHQLPANGTIFQFSSWIICFYLTDWSWEDVTSSGPEQSPDWTWTWTLFRAAFEPLRPHSWSCTLKVSKVSGCYYVRREDTPRGRHSSVPWRQPPSALSLCPADAAPAGSGSSGERTELTWACRRSFCSTTVCSWWSTSCMFLWLAAWHKRWLWKTHRGHGQRQTQTGRHSDHRKHRRVWVFGGTEFKRARLIIKLLCLTSSLQESDP